jgi:hypothetical protein
MSALNELVECRGGYPDELGSLASIERERAHFSPLPASAARAVVANIASVLKASS